MNAINQVNSLDKKPLKKPLTREDLIERDRLNRERYKLSLLEEAPAIPTKKQCSTEQALEIRYRSLPPVAKMILNILDARSAKWASQPFNQQWLADDIGCTLRWIRYCISLLKQLGFIAVIPINRGKPYKCKDGFWTYPNIYIVTPFLRWAQSAKLYSLIVAQAEKIKNDFLQLSNMFNKYIKRENKHGNNSQKSKNVIGNVLRNNCSWLGQPKNPLSFLKTMIC